MLVFFAVFDAIYLSYMTRLHRGLLAVVIWNLIGCHHLARVRLAIPSSTATLTNGPKVIEAKNNNSSSQEKLSNPLGTFGFNTVFYNHGCWLCCFPVVKSHSINVLLRTHHLFKMNFMILTF